MASKKDTKTDVERDYIIPLRSSFRLTARHKKTPKAMRALRDFLKKHMKSENIKLGMHLNEFIWKNGIKNPPHHVKVHVTKKGDEVKAELSGFVFKEAVKSEKKKEPETVKDKLAAKLGVDTKDEPLQEKKEVDKTEVKEDKSEEKSDAPKEEKKTVPKAKAKASIKKK